MAIGVPCIMLVPCAVLPYTEDAAKSRVSGLCATPLKGLSLGNRTKPESPVAIEITVGFTDFKR
jgi:hypothetical protein